MKSKEDKAIRSFKSGLNCAQAVLTAYSDDLSFDNSLALNLSCGFGGGMGRLQETYDVHIRFFPKITTIYNTLEANEIS